MVTCMAGRTEWGDTLTGAASILSELAAHEVEVVLRRAGMGMGAFDLLSAVRAAGGRETLGQIAERMGIVPSSLTEAIAPAERRGFVERLTVDSNRRAKRILLTEAGERLLDECLAALQAQESRLREAIPAEELSRAIATLQKACETLAMHGHHKDG